jgi:flavin reductase (DIM6/NTAB) family NADH-FMN oxidoreductase RutF
MIVDPSQIDRKDGYKLMIGSIVPRPIAFVSTVSPDGVLNLAPFSFFTAVSARPMTICFSSMRRNDGGKKDTLINVEATGEFVVNVVSERYAQEMNITSGDFPPEVDEFEQAGLTSAPSESVRPPRLAESLVSYECKLLQVVHVGEDQPGGGALILGTVQRLYVAEEVMEDGRIKLDVLQPIGRMAGNDYVRCTDLFTMTRPRG